MLKLVRPVCYDEAQTEAACLRIRLVLSVALAEAVAEVSADCPNADLREAVNGATDSIESMLETLLKRAKERQS